MAANPLPISSLHTEIDKTPTQAVVRCSGRITSDSSESLKAAVKPLFQESKTVVLDLTDTTYMDSSGLCTIV